MNERFFDGRATAREIELLASAADDAPTPAARQQALAALGLSAFPLPSVPPPALPIASTASGGVAAMVKAALVGAGLGLVTLASVVPAIRARALREEPPIATVQGPEEPKLPSRRVEPVLASVASTPAPSRDVAKPTRRAIAPPPPEKPPLAIAPLEPTAAPIDSALPAPAPPPVVVDVSTLREETALLEQAREAVPRDPRQALGVLDAYDRKFPTGTLREEASVLRIQSLLGAGDRAAAARLAEEFLRLHPTGPYAARVRLLIP